MRMIQQTPITLTNLTSSNIAIDSDSATYGAAWKGEWSSSYAGGYSIGDAVYRYDQLYESITDTNSENPITHHTGETATWLHIGAVNRFRMFDEYTNTKTVGTAPDINDESKIILELNIAQVEYVAFFNLEALYVDVELLDGATSVWAGTLDLWADVDDVSDWYEYFFGDDSQPHIDGTVQLGWVTYSEKIRITIVNISAEAECGMCIIGRGRYLGATQNQPEVGIIDYSRKSTDDFGRTYLKQGSYAKLVKGQLFVENTAFDATNLFLTQARGTACVWDFNEESTNYNALLVYGFYQDFRKVIEGPTNSSCSLDIQGLI